ncbi:MAG TPA: hypothetical protein PKD54_07380 [Pirellulaceae bacterium]|nr:hypothetical protein [Pirellulaceae bacterium]
MTTFKNVRSPLGTWRLRIHLVIAVMFTWPAVSILRPVCAQDSPSSDDTKTPQTTVWEQVRERIIPLPFFKEGKQEKVNLERLLAQLLDESVFPNNPLQIEEEQRRELIRVWRQRQASIEANGYDLKTLALEASKIGPLIDWEKLAPGLDVYGEQRQTVMELSRILKPSQTTIWRDMAIAQLHHFTNEFTSIIQIAGQKYPEVHEAIMQGSLNWTELLMSAAIEDVRLKHESYIQIGRIFDRITAVLPATERNQLDRYLKMDALK